MRFLLLAPLILIAMAIGAVLGAAEAIINWHAH